MLFFKGKTQRKTLAPKLVPNHVLAPMADLPPDVLTEILLLLPVKSILRFRSFSRSWKSLIDSHDFTALHLKFHKQNSNPNVVFAEGSHVYSLKLPTLEEEEDLNQTLSSYENDRITILGSCNGLLCIKNSLHDIAIWNPSLRKHWILPCLTSFRYPPYGRFGFGFDSFKEDYKVVTISEFKHVGGLFNFVSKASIFSCRTNSWSSPRKVPFPFSWIDTMGIFVDHALHWAVEDGSGKHVGPKLIVSFDLRSEVFKKVPLPKLDAGFEIDQVSHLGGCLSMVVNYKVDYRKGENYQNENRSPEIWVMKQYGCEDSWFQLVTLVEPLKLRSLEFLEPYSGEGVTVYCRALLRKMDMLFWCNFKSKQVSHVRTSVPLDAMAWVQSLVQPLFPKTKRSVSSKK